MAFTVKCPNCKRSMRLSQSRYGWYYVCPTDSCDISHGCHQRTKRPLGLPADRRTRRARSMAHDVFDKLWNSGSRKQKKIRRDAAYAWLREALNLSKRACHISRFDRDTCMKVCKLAGAMDTDKLRELGYL